MMGKVLDSQLIFADERGGHYLRLEVRSENACACPVWTDFKLTDEKKLDNQRDTILEATLGRVHGSGESSAKKLNLWATP